MTESIDEDAPLHTEPNLQKQLFVITNSLLI